MSNMIEDKIKALSLMGEGKSNAKIAEKFDISIAIIEEWAEAQVDKLKDASRDELATYNAELTEVSLLKAKVKQLKKEVKSVTKIAKIEVKMAKRETKELKALLTHKTRVAKVEIQDLKALLKR